MVRTLRRLGIALGVYVAARLVIGAFTPMDNTLAVIVAALLGALVYLDIIRREERRA